VLSGDRLHGWNNAGRHAWIRGDQNFHGRRRACADASWASAPGEEPYAAVGGGLVAKSVSRVRSRHFSTSSPKVAIASVTAW
jgi:hypothetical protein